MAAELRLGVSFDLAYFRTQLQKLGRIAASEFTAPIKIKLNRQVIDKELNELQRSIKRRKYNVELNIAGNLSKKSFDELQERLDALSKRKKIEVPVSIKNAATGKEIAEAITALRSRIAQNQSVRQGDGKLRIGTSIRAAISNDDIARFKNAVKEKFSGVTNKADVSIGIKNAASGKDVADTVNGIRGRINQNQSVKQGGGKLRVGLSIKPAITNADVAGFKRAVEEKFSGLSVKIKADVQAGFASGQTGAAGLYEYMRTQGLSGGNVPGAAQVGRRAQFEAAVAQATNKELQDMLRRADVPGRSGLRTKAAMQERLLQLGDAAMENLLGSLEMRMREPRKVERSFLDKVARAVFWMAGVDPEYLRQQAAQRRALPNVSFPATVPPGPPIGPSSTGRALPPGVIPGALPGSAFARQRFLPPQIGQDLNRILRNAAFAFVDSLNSRIRQVNVREIGRQALPPSMIRGLLPAGVGREPSIYGGPAQADRASFLQRRIDEALARSAERGAAIMANEPRGGVLGAGGSGAAGPYRPFDQPPRGGAIVPYQAPSQFGPSSQLPSGYFQTGKLAAGIRGIGADFNQARLPLSGAVRELGGEFATATKQVLLFGTAYKALAFFTSLPGQAFEAAKGLQTINNQLQAVTGSVQNADRSFAFIDNLANRFNVPLQSARDGFVKLYASMEPAGFSGSEIEGLFEGISKATATFGLSADQVDRVNNAFSQMASKGQIMSEELKGQLGDVLPGSLALFAKAAQMSIPDFSKAMEDGAFKGEAMAQVLRNVAKIMNSDFGGAAANAANTLQGALNGMQNAVQRLYEAFEPLVDAVASQAFPLIQEAIAEATAAVTAFGATIQGNEGPANMLEGNARALYNTMLSVREVFTAVGRIIQGLVPTFTLLGQVIITIADAISRVINTRFGGFLADVALKVGIGMIAVQAFARVMGFQLVAALVTAAQSATTFTGSIKAMVIALRSSEAASKAARLALTGLAVGAVLMGIEALISVIGRLANRLKDARNRAIEARDAIKSMNASELATEQRKINLAKQALARAQETGRSMVTEEEYEILKGYGLTDEFEKGSRIGKRGGKATQEIKIPKEFVPSRLLKLSDIEAARDRAMKDLYFTPSSPDLEKIDLAAGDGSGGRGAKERESQVPQLQLRLELSKKLFDIDMRLAEARLKENTALETELELIRKLTELDYQRREILLENIPDNEKALKIEELKLQRQQAILASQLKLRLDLNNQYMKSQDALTKIIDAQVEETSYAKKYQELVLSGVNPALAKTTVEVTKRFAEEVKSLDTQIQQLEVSIATAETTIELLKLKESLTDTEKEQLDNAQKNLETFREHLRLRKQAKGEVPEAVQRTITEQQAAEARNPFGVTIAEGYERAKQELEDLADPANMLVSAANSIGDAFGQMFTDIATGAQTWREALGNAFRSVASMFADMVAQMLAKWAAMQILQMFLPGGGGLFSGNASITGGGFGSFSGGSFGVDSSGTLGQVGASLTARPFANGGLVTGPTLGLVGEGRFNEAVVPLPNGKSIPVDLGDGAGSNISTNIVVNVNNGQASSQVNGAGGQSLGRELEGAVRSVILKESRPGGIIYNQR